LFPKATACGEHKTTLVASAQQAVLRSALGGAKHHFLRGGQGTSCERQIVLHIVREPGGTAQSQNCSPSSRVTSPSWARIQARFSYALLKSQRSSDTPAFQPNTVAVSPPAAVRPTGEPFRPQQTEHQLVGGAVFFVPRNFVRRRNYF